MVDKSGKCREGLPNRFRIDPKLAPTLGGVGEWGLRFGTRQLCRAAVGYRPLGGNWVSGAVGPPFIWIPGAIVGTQPDVAGASVGFRPQWGGGVSRVGEPSDWISAGASTPNRPRSGPKSAPNRSEIEPNQAQHLLQIGFKSGQNQPRGGESLGGGPIFKFLVRFCVPTVLDSVAQP